MNRDRPELLIGDYQGIAKRCALAFDYAHEEVPDFRRAPIREACTKYDLDGVELDFMRTFIFFKLGAERPEVVRMSEFMAQVRALLDEIGRFSWHAFGGRHTRTLAHLARELPHLPSDPAAGGPAAGARDLGRGRQHRPASRHRLRVQRSGTADSDASHDAETGAIAEWLKSRGHDESPSRVPSRHNQARKTFQAEATLPTNARKATPERASFQRAMHAKPSSNVAATKPITADAASEYRMPCPPDPDSSILTLDFRESYLVEELLPCMPHS